MSTMVSRTNAEQTARIARLSLGMKWVLLTRVLRDPGSGAGLHHSGRIGMECNTPRGIEISRSRRIHLAWPEPGAVAVHG